jgi:hypothetical protein
MWYWGSHPTGEDQCSCGPTFKDQGYDVELSVGKGVFARKEFLMM